MNTFSTLSGQAIMKVVSCDLNSDVKEMIPLLKMSITKRERKNSENSVSTSQGKKSSKRLRKWKPSWKSRKRPTQNSAAKAVTTKILSFECPLTEPKRFRMSQNRSLASTSASFIVNRRNCLKAATEHI
jgi:hypothetical protein